MTHRTIRAVTEDMERLRYNVAISKLQVLTNAMRSALDAGDGAREAASALTQLLAPLAPFAAEELWREVLGNGSSVHTSAWPTFDDALARQERVTLVVQVDGKVRDRIEVDSDAGEETCRELALALGQGAARARRPRDRQGDRPRSAPGEPGDGPLGTSRAQHRRERARYTGRGRSRPVSA